MNGSNLNDGTLTIGITDFGQEQLGPLVYVDMPAVGKVLAKGPSRASSSPTRRRRTACPVDGEVIAINELLVETPDAINGAPYEQWIFKLKPAARFRLKASLMRRVTSS
jgi:glycine cleavage system H protein